MKSGSMPAFLLPTSDAYHKYFSDEVCDSLELIEADYGLKGFAVVIKLWQKIYGSSEGYYCEWNDKVCSLFAKRNGVSKGLVFEIVNRMVRDGIFDKALFEKYSILTSEWIQQNWLDYTKRRQCAKIKNEFSVASRAQKSENVCKNAKNVCKNKENANKKTTTEQNITEHNRTERNVTEDPALLLTETQRKELVSMSSVGSVTEYENKILLWQAEKGKRCRDPYGTIKKWIAEDKAKSPRGEPSFDLEEYDRYTRSIDLDEIDPSGRKGADQ